MLITIYDSVGNPKVDLSPNDSSTQVKEVQGDSILTLSFTHYEHIELDVDDYADFLGERFWLTEKYRPRQNSKKEWVYDLKLYGVESMIKRLLVIKTVDNEDNPVFTLTAPPRDHVAMIVKCMNDGMGNTTDWKVGQVNGTENIVIDYIGKYCDEALKEIAEKVGAEWWVEGQTVNICKCEHGEPVELGYNKGLLSIDPGTADNVKFYTRLYPVGSSRNIDREKYGFTRLHLPGGQKYVEINADKYGRVDHFEQSAFEDIYPRRVGSVSNVRSEVKTGEDGNPFTIYYFTDNSLPFDPNDYMIGGLVIRVSFQEGSELAGLGEEDNGTYFFDVNFNSSTREFEIITIWPYDSDIQLPGDKLIPKAGDKYILWNLRMPDEYYALAEEEFLTAVNQYNAEHNLDITVYKSPTDHVWIEDNDVELTVGRRVRLESEEYFPGFGFRDSRITKITRKVNLPSSMDIEISDALSRTSQEKMADSIADVRSYANSIRDSISLPDIIRIGDKTLPTDNNLLSARRSYKEFLNKNKPDIATEIIKFEKGSEFGNFVKGFAGAIVDANGNAEVESLTSRSYLKVFELIYNRINSFEGNTSFADFGTIEAVSIDAGNEQRLIMRKRWDGDFTAFQPGDVIYGYVNDLDNNKQLSYYKVWGWVKNVDRVENMLDIMLYPDAEVPAGVNFRFAPEMVINRWGNNIEPSKDTYINPDYNDVVILEGGKYRNIRQSSFYISCDDGNIIELMGVNKPILEPSNYGTVLGQIPDGLLDKQTEELINKDQPYLFARGIIVQDLIRIGYQGNVIRTANYRGGWNKATAYNPDTCYRSTLTSYDTVTYDGKLWQLLYDYSRDEPGTSGAWLKMTDNSKTAEIWTIAPSAATITLHEDGSADPEWLTCLVQKHNGDGTSTYTDNYQLYKEDMLLYVSLDGKDFVNGDETIEVDGDSDLEAEVGDPFELGGNYDFLPDRSNMAEFVMDKSNEPLESEKGDPFEVEAGGDTIDVTTVDGGNIASHAVANKVVFYLIRKTDKEIMAHAVVNVVRDGARGSDGVDGLMVYPAGRYDENTLYSSTDGTSPVVEYANQYFMLRRGWTYKGVEMADERNNPAKDWGLDSPEDPARWQLFDKFKAVFTDVLMADFAKLGSAVFYEDWMISQQGMRNGLPSSEYKYFKDGSFIPNFSVNFKTGEINAATGVFSGSLLTKFKTLNESDATKDDNYNYTLRKDLKILSYGPDKIILPSDTKYIGQRVLICNNVTCYSRTPQETTILTQAESYLLGHPADASETAPTDDSDKRTGTCILTGIIELVAIPNQESQDKCNWFILTLNAKYTN